MLLGQESATSARRTDLRIAVGDVGIHLEAKRLASKGQWCHGYVHEGMARFVTCAYGSGEDLGMMIGYVQQPRPDGLLDCVNGFIYNHAYMGYTHQLAATTGHSQGLWHESNHDRVANGPINIIVNVTPLHPPGNRSANTSGSASAASAATRSITPYFRSICAVDLANVA